MLFPQATEQALYRLAQERFRAESLEEFEGRLIAASRVPELVGEIEPAAFAETCKQRDRGLLLLAPHFDSFWLGTVFLGLAGIKVHAMTSRVIHHVSVIPAVQRHFVDKYRAMETYMNGGRMLHAEDGLRPFYQILEKGECLVILADAPAVAAGAVVTPCFLGHRRQMAGGAVRLARKTGCDLGAFVCRYQKPGRYLVKGGPIMPASDPQALDTIYCFLSDEIMADPGRWCATDLLPLMKPVDTKENC
jgi:lauroyl/myristoyl acyltransferase